MADRAIGDQDCDIDAIFATARQDVRAIDFKRMSLAAIGGDAVKAWRHRSNQACGCGAPQCRQREPAVGIIRELPAVDAHVRDAQIVVHRGVARIGFVEFGCGVVRRLAILLPFAGIERSCGGEQCHPTLGQRFAQPRERHILKGCIAVVIVRAEGVVPGMGTVDVANRHIPVRGKSQRIGFEGHECLLCVPVHGTRAIKREPC